MKIQENQNTWEFDHIGFVVENVDKAFEFYQSLGMIVERAPMSLGSDLRVCFFKQGDLSMEFIQPGANSSMQGDYLKKHGEGVNHICYRVKNLDEEKRKMEANNIPLIFEVRDTEGVIDERIPACHVAFFDTSKVGNVLLELLQIV
jgi:methylmalonyl-CoA/ethylmalonyl-CoA epimerase